MVITIGVDVFEYAYFPLLNVTKRIAIGHFYRKNRSPCCLYYDARGHHESTVFIYCSLKGLEYVFWVPYRYFTFPITMLVSVFSILIAANYSDHLEKLMSSLIFTFYGFMQFIIPMITIIILIWRTQKNNSAQNGVK